MYYLLHRQNVPDKVTTPPDGLTELMSDITREVLRSQPAAHCLYKFIADYLDALLRVREKTMITQSVIDDLIQSSQNVHNFLQQSGICYDKAQKAAAVIQKSFHDFIKTKRCNQFEELKEFKEIELISELITKCKFTEREIQRSSPGIRKAFRQFLSDYLNLMKATVYGASTVVPIVQFTFKATVQGNLDILHTSATIIQATFRGYKVRAQLKTQSLEFDIFITKIMKHPYVKKERIKRSAPFDPLKYECIKDEMLYCKLSKAAEIIQRNYRRYHSKTIFNYAFSKRILDRAATIIQKIYRGFLARKLYKNKKSFESYKKYYGSPADECQYKFYNNKATEIQKTYKGYVARKEYEKMKKMVNFKEHYGESIGEDKYKMYNDKATIIQSNYKGYITRKHFKNDHKELYKDPIINRKDPTINEPKVELSIGDNLKAEKGEVDLHEHYVQSISEDQRKIYNEKATKIQSNYRGFRTRKHFKDLGIFVHHNAAKARHDEPVLTVKSPLEGINKPAEEAAGSKGSKENLSPEPIEETSHEKLAEASDGAEEAEELNSEDEAEAEGEE